MTPIQTGLHKLRELGEDPDERLLWNFRHGYVYSSPTAFAMAHIYAENRETALWVEIVAGDMAEALSHAPRTKRVCYLRHGRLKSVSFDKLCRRLNHPQPLESFAPAL